MLKKTKLKFLQEGLRVKVNSEMLHDMVIRRLDRYLRPEEGKMKTSLAVENQNDLVMETKSITKNGEKL